MLPLRDMSISSPPAAAAPSSSSIGFTFHQKHWVLVLPADGSPVHFSQTKPSHDVLRTAPLFGRPFPGMNRVTLHHSLATELHKFFVADFASSATRCSDLFWCMKIDEGDAGTAVLGSYPTGMQQDTDLVALAAFTLDGAFPRSSTPINRYFTDPHGDHGRLVDTYWETLSPLDAAGDDSAFLQAPLAPSARPEPPRGDVRVVMIYNMTVVPFPDQLGCPSIEPPLDQPVFII